MHLDAISRQGRPEDRVPGADPLRFREGPARWLRSGTTDALRDLLDACREDLRLALGGDAPDEAYRLVRDRRARRGQRRLLGLFGADGRLVAAMDAYCHSPTAEAWRLALLLVRPDQRGRGIGSGLLARLERMARADRATSIEALAPGRNPAVLQLLLRAGFEPRGDVVVGLGGRELRGRRLVRTIAPVLDG